MKRITLLSCIALTLLLVSNAKPNIMNDCSKGSCTPLPIPIPEATIGDAASMIMVAPVDPNELKGPIGVDSVRWVSKNDVLNYTVLFENDPEFATAHAQIVDIRVDLPHERLLDNFTLGTYTFANRAYEMPNEPNFYSLRLDCRDSLNIYVDVLAGLDMDKNQAFWHFSSIDPETGYAPWQVDRGMLPVNDSTHVGEGFVTFRLKPHEDMVTGDTISFNARILFDYNDTIPTNYWCNKIDAGAPTSRIKAVVDSEDYTHYRLSFEAEDDKNGCGVKQIYLYLADNLGTYNEYAVCAVDSILDFTIERGKQYSFMTIAEDRVGNREEIKTKPDLILNFNEPPTDILLSNTIFQDDISLDGFIGSLSSVDADNDGSFTYELTEGEGAIHNEMFKIIGNQLLANDCFKCSDIELYSIRISTTDAGGLSYSKQFKLELSRVLEEPEPQTLDVEICHGDEYIFYGEKYNKTGTYIHRTPNEFMCDSVYILNLTILPIPEIPTITVSGKSTLISSAEYGNQWYKDGYPIEDATEKQYTASETGLYSVTASNGKCESEQSEDVFVNLDELTDISIPLSQGWNWISSNVDDDGVKSPNTFFASVLDNVQIVRSKGGILNNEGKSLNGDIDAITPATYKVKMATNSTLTLSAELCDPENYQHPLSAGWNWIPYIPVVELDVQSSFSGFTPQQNDVIKSHTSFATYHNGNWVGTLRTLQPNCGYMYYTTQTSTLNYSQSRVERTKSAVYLSETSSKWNVDKSNYADNMTIIAKVYNGETPAFDAAYTIAAFCGNECRGVSEYVGDKIFMIVYGNVGDKITFKAEENATGKEIEITQYLTFDEKPLGTVSSPYVIQIEDNSGIINTISDIALSIYPNPVRDYMFIAGDISAVNSVKVISSSGEILITTDDFGSGVNVSSLQDGIYIAALVTSQGVIYHKFIKYGLYE